MTLLMPAKLTLLLQPLDSHVLGQFKVAVQRKHQQARSASASGSAGIVELVSCIQGAITEVVQGLDWMAAFDHNGFGADSQLISKRVLSAICSPEIHFLSADRPSVAELQVCFPLRHKVPYASLWKCVGALIAEKSLAAEMPFAVVVPEDPPPHGPMGAHGCLPDFIAVRSRSRLRIKQPRLE